MWGDEVDSFSNTVRVHMASLRKKNKNGHRAEFDRKCDRERIYDR
ncbi:hypothetical protein [Suipraeoptans intestinalis]